MQVAMLEPIDVRRPTPRPYPSRPTTTLAAMASGAPTTPEPENRSAGRPEKGSSGRAIGVGALVALAVAGALLAWVLVDRSDDDDAAAPTQTAEATTPTLESTPAETVSQPTLQTIAALRAAAAISPNPIYWAGARAGTRLEVSQTSSGTVFVRYLPNGTAAGDLEPHLTVATYARPNAYTEVQAAAKNEGSAVVELEDGGLAVYDKASPTNLHIAYQGEAFQVEVFSPEDGEALRLVENGKIKPVP